MQQAAQDHTGVRNYVWSDTDKKFCLGCHPDGRQN
jgi:predicted CXXCH cytochrome family protein